MKCIETPITEMERKRRVRLRDMYLTDPEMLWNLLVEHWVFTPITNQEQTTMRNWALKHLEDIGILDEAKLRKALLSLLEADVVDEGQADNAPDPYSIPTEI